MELYEALGPSSFECSACKGAREEQHRLRGKGNHQRKHEIEKLRQKRLAAFPEGVVPAKPELVGFTAGRASDFSVSIHYLMHRSITNLNPKRSEYFGSMKRTDMLNILSLCDQLKPQLLADVLVSVSKKHPDLPIFSSPDWDTQATGPLRSIPNQAGRHPRPDGARHGHSLVNSKIRNNKQNATKKILKRTRVIEVTTDVQDENEDALPPSWPKAGEGLYAKLPPETEDRQFLIDENDEESFSHFLVDNLGKQVVEPVGA